MEYDDNVVIEMCEINIEKELVDEAPNKKGTGMKKRPWPSLDLEMNKNQQYELSHIRVITEDSFEVPEQTFILACIHCELYTNRSG